MAKARIVVVGSTNTDLTVLAERLPAPGETVLGGELMQAGGGKGANQAVAAARAGAHVAFVGRVGADDFGRATIEDLRREGIDTTHTGVDEHAASGVALIMVDRGGENLIAVASGANARLTPGARGRRRRHDCVRRTWCCCNWRYRCRPRARPSGWRGTPACPCC